MSTLTTDHCSPKATQRESRRQAISTRTLKGLEGRKGGRKGRQAKGTGKGGGGEEHALSLLSSLSKQ